MYTVISREIRPIFEVSLFQTVITVGLPERHGQTDDILWHNRAQRSTAR